MKLCLNMIVKNEAANIARCLASVLPHVAAAVIVDTGSTDDTMAIVAKMCADARVPLRAAYTPFKNWGHTRTCALDTARASGLDFDYILLVDADMELVVDAPWPTTGAPAYCLRQRSGTLDYSNYRLVHRDAPARYIGVTHEYLSVERVVEYDGIWFIDHASGSNRMGKFDRDIELLEKALVTEPQNGRYWFYLAQSYRDAGRTNDAVNAYTKRIGMGGWDEETYIAKLERARAYKKVGFEHLFIASMADIYSDRPQRAEPLADLAEHYRVAGKHATACIYAEAGLSIPFPKADCLFVERPAYDWRCQQNFSISAFYNEKRRKEGYQVCDSLIVNARAPDWVRAEAKANMFHYLPPLRELCPSFAAGPIEWTPPDEHYTPTNPSIVCRKHDLFVNVRTVNYLIRPDGSYDMQGDTAIRTKNHLLHLDDHLNILASGELVTHHSFVRPPLYDQVIGFEDIRLFEHRGFLGFNATVRDHSVEGMCEQVLGRIDPDTYTIDAYEVVRPPVRQHEKNWMAVSNGGVEPSFIYRAGHVIDAYGKTVAQHAFGEHTFEHFSGGSPLISFDGGFLAVTHEAWIKPGHTKRFYQHRFVWFDHELHLCKVSLPFYLNEKGIEFVAGLARHPKTGEFLLSYGVDDRSAWIGSVKAEEVREFLWT